jgi:fibronectin-binding autotransporter adhesin
MTPLLPLYSRRGVIASNRGKLMNRIFRIVWCAALGAWVVASELAGRHGKGRGRPGTGVVDDRRLLRRATGRWSLRLGVAASLISLCLPAHAVDRYWDVNGGAVGSGGTGTWNTSSAYWNDSSDGVAGPFHAWNNAALDNAIFAGSAGTVTLGGPVTANAMTFGTTGYTLTGGTLTLAGAAPGILVTNTSDTATIDSAIAGSAGLTKAGGGTLVLGGANTFSGGINVGAGTLTLNGTSSFTGDVNVANGATLAVGNDAALGVAGNRIVTSAGANLTATGALAASRTVSLGGGGLTTITGSGVASARYTGTGDLLAYRTSLLNNANDYTGKTTVQLSAETVNFSSVGDLGVASALGAASDPTLGTIAVQRVFGATGYFTYIGTGNDSNRKWELSAGGHLVFSNSGSGKLTLRGDIGLTGTSGTAVVFSADTADLAVLGQIGLTGPLQRVSFSGGAGRTITLGDSNSFSAPATITTVKVQAGTLADGGVSSSLGAGTDVSINGGGVLSYTGSGASSNRTWSVGDSNISNDGTGALNLSGAASFNANARLTFGGAYTGVNTFSGAISGAGALASSGNGTWVLSGANTRSGALRVDSGTLRAGSATAFGTTSTVTVNGGTLDLNGFNLAAGSLAGTGGTVALGGATLTASPSSGTTTYAGSIMGSGGYTKLGAGTQQLTGQNTYTGATTVGGGTLALDFTAANAPASNIISSASTLNMGGGTLMAIGSSGQTQSFAATNISAGGNTITGTGNVSLNLGAINRSAGLVNFVLPGTGNITTTPATVLGGWATVTSGTTTDYAQVDGAGNIVARTVYENKDNASTWVDGDVVSDTAGTANSPYAGTLAGNVQLGGIKYTAAAPSTVTVGTGNTLGIDGTIIVSASVGNNTDTITGGQLTGTVGGGPLSVLQNGSGNFAIASSIVDNGGATGFTKAGTGLVTVSGVNSYTGATTISGGTLSVNAIANGGAQSAIGGSSSAPSNLLLQGGTLQYTGASTSSDRGFTLATNGAVTADVIDVTQSGSNLLFSGAVVSPDNAGLTKTGAGTLTLSNANNTYTGVTAVNQGTLAVGTLANGGINSGIGAASGASSNLVLQNGGELEYTGGTTTSNRGFTLGSGGGAIDVALNTTSLTMSGVATGTGGLTKNGPGTLVLSGANTYSGGTVVNAGTLRAGSTNAFGPANPGPMTVNTAATLDLAGNNNTVGGLNGSGSVLLGNATLTIGAPAGSFSGTIGGSGSVWIGGVGNQTFGGCGNSYTGATRINGVLTVGCLANGGQVSDIGSSSSDPSNLIFVNGTLNYTGGSFTTDRGFSMPGFVSATIGVQDGGATLAFTGQVTGPGGYLVKSGPGTLLLSGANTYSGGTAVSAGIVRAGSTSAFGTGSMTVGSGATLDLANLSNTVASLDGGGVVTLGSGTLTLNTGVSTRYGDAGTNQNFTGTISGSGGLVKNGGPGQTQTLSGMANSYTGPTTVNGGTLAVNSIANGNAASSIGASGSAAGNLVLNGGTLQYLGAGNSTDRLFTLGPSSTSALDASGTGALHFANTGALAFSGVSGTAQTVTLTGSSSADNSLSLQLTDNGTGKTSLSKTGTGTWILKNPASTYTGVTTIAGGVLGVDKLANANQASSIGASAGDAGNLVIGSGSTLRYTGAGDTTDRLFTLSSGVSFIESSGTGAIVFSNTGSAQYSGSGSRTLALGGTNTGLNVMGGTIIDGTGGTTTLAKNDAGTWALTGNNTYTGNTVINGGILQLGNGGTSGSIASANIINAAGTLVFDRSDTLALAGTISGAGDVVQQGTGTTTLTAANTYTGGTRIAAGTLQLGSGGANGSILGDVTDNGTLAFNRSDIYAFGGLISGTGAVIQRGGGTAILTAANTYKGATTVAAGSLLVNGDQSAATGATTVQTGGALGGKGTIGGNVTVADGGTLNPGDAGSAGTLTIQGNLALGAGATMNYQFGQPDVVGGQLNDLTVVHGNLALDGTLNLSATPGGSFGPGLYRIISYDGALADDGLALGTTPVGTYQVQTSMAHQVNLLNSGGLSLNFWDGPNGHGNGTIDGGSGLWQSSGGNDNWTDQTGQYNAPHAENQFAIFSGTPGTVTVDNTAGTPISSGMQFAVDGYTITGSPLILGSATTNIIRVGDGTAAGAGMTATINAPLNGFNGLVKDDLGTLVLGGSNTYSGGTTINAGTLQVSSNANLGFSVAPLAFNGGTLRNTGAFSTVRAVTLNQGGGTFDTQANLGLTGAIGGAGSLTKTGTGILTLSGTNTYAGGTSVTGGAVSVSADANLGNATGGLTLDGGMLQNTASFGSTRGVTLGAGGGSFQTVADLTLGGVIGGAGALTKSGGGALVLAADNTFGGGSTIADGTLQLGNGGTTGSVTGNVVDNGALVFGRADTYAFAGTISGTGAVEQDGSGVVVLSANNSYGGPTAVRAGTLVVNGDQSAATGSTSVDAGATLRGNGVIGGNVTIADGGTLDPGDIGSAPGMLAIKGALALGNTSRLDVNFGQANVVGGPLNDLVQVSGDLTLDGTLNVASSSGGSFDPGIYRVISYGGALTDNGLGVGSVPTPDYFLQTSIAHQVNLVNTAGLSVNFWDGNGGRGDGQLLGGDGVWQNSAGNDNWTSGDGSVNAAYSDGDFAIFAGTGGTVTVDGGLGGVTSSGMQFATDGYRVEGDDIALDAAPAVIRVGDGTAAGAGMTATLASRLTGNGGVTKSDLGTLVLAGDNTYTGGTTIAGGTLQLGEGGASGSIVGGVTNEGLLVFDRSDTYAFDGVVSGSGSLVQKGGGSTVLTGANTYTGATRVQAGSLWVNGEQSDATGTTTVDGGATLGGAGSIGGDVAVADGATLSPGAAPGAAGTLTINGNLSLSPTAALQYELGEAGKAGGTLNDLTVVHGNLVLDGMLNVSATSGGSFGPGVYRLFSYDGSLVDNGLAVGVTPTADAFVQTSIARQVNLVNTAGLSLSFWDGPDSANDGAIAGGNGTWRLADNDYWSEASGAINAPYTNGSFAVFAGTGGTVTVDDSRGNIEASGLQFQADGYRITGGELVLTGGASSIRVGDGTAAGAGMTATIDAAIGGGSMLVKDDLGTLVLGGSNTYAGGTDVRAGTLQVGSDGSLGDAGGALSLDNGTLHTTGSFLSGRRVGLGGDASIETDGGTTLRLTGTVTGPGSLTKKGGGALVLGGESSYSGATTVAGGTLAAGIANAFSASSAFSVQGGSTLDLDGHSQRIASLANAGNVALGNAPGTTLTVAGDYVGQGGTLTFDAALGADDSVSDRLVVAGNTSGDTTVRVTNVGGAGAQTASGIKLIDVQGQSNGRFSLQGDYVFEGQQAVVAGAYAYRLYKDGAGTQDGDWYLRSALTNPPAGGGDPTGPADPVQPLYQPGVPLYEAYAGALQQLNKLDTLTERTGRRQWANAQGANGMSPGEGVWIRVQGSDQTLKPETSTSGANYDVSTWKTEVGVDTVLGESEGGKLVGGATLRYGRDHSGVRSVYGEGRIRTDEYGVGASLTWYGDHGFYVDGQARATRFDTDLRSTTLRQSLKDGNKAYGYAVGVEVGQRFGLGDHLWVIPQAQLSYGSVRFDSFNDAFGARVSQKTGKALTARGGLAIDYDRNWQGTAGAVASHVYAIANVYKTSKDGARVDVAGTGFTTRNESTWGGFGIGTSLDWAGGRYSVYGDVQASTGLTHFGDSHAVSGNIGFRMRW